MEQPLISIAMCTYNGARYLVQQLDSILAQTYNNIEVIIVDDLSTDNTFEIITAYAAKDDRVKCYLNEVNLGYNKNFEKAISLSNGAYIAISDQDDIWKQDKIEVLFNNIGDNWLIFSNSEWMEEDGTNTREPLLNESPIESNTYKAILINNFMAGHSSLFRREFAAQILPFPEQGFYDWWMLFVALYHHKATYVHQVLTSYRRHNHSVIQQMLTKDKKKLDYNLYKVNIDQYEAFERYSELKTADKEFITRLKNAFLLKEKYAWSVPLANILYNNYTTLFPVLKPRGILSKLNFVLKKAKKVSKA